MYKGICVYCVHNITLLEMHSFQKTTKPWISAMYKRQNWYLSKYI